MWSSHHLLVEGTEVVGQSLDDGAVEHGRCEEQDGNDDGADGWLGKIEECAVGEEADHGPGCEQTEAQREHGRYPFPAYQSAPGGCIGPDKCNHEGAPEPHERQRDVEEDRWSEGALDQSGKGVMGQVPQ